MKHLTLILVILALAVGFLSGHFLWPVPQGPQVGRYSAQSEHTILDTQTGDVWNFYNGDGAVNGCEWMRVAKGLSEATTAPTP